LACRHCQQRLSTGTTPRWAVHRPGAYIIAIRWCNSSSCKGKTVKPLPVDQSIPSTSTSITNLFQLQQVLRKPFYLRYEKKGSRIVIVPPLLSVSVLGAGNIHSLTRVPAGRSVLDST
jgi:hypothetical protein